MNSLDMVIKNLGNFAKDLDSFCADLRDRTKDDAVRLILYHVASGRRRIAESIKCLTDVEKSAFEQARLSEDDVVFLSERVFADIFIASAAGKIDLVDTVIEALDVLASYYEWLLGQKLGESSKTFFENLLKKQREEISQLEALKTHPAL